MFKFIVTCIVIVGVVWFAVSGVPYLIDVASTYEYSDGDIVSINPQSECWQHPGGEEKIGNFYAPNQRIIVTIVGKTSAKITGNPDSFNEFRGGDYLRVIVGGRPCWIQVNDISH